MFKTLPSFGLFFASFLALTIVCLLPYRLVPERSVGYYLYVATGCPFHDVETIDRVIVLVVRDDGSLRINLEETPRIELQQRLRDIYQWRASKDIYIHADDDVDVQTLSSALDVAHTAVSGLRIKLIPAASQPCEEGQVPPIT